MLESPSMLSTPVAGAESAGTAFPIGVRLSCKVKSVPVTGIVSSWRTLPLVGRIRVLGSRAMQIRFWIARSQTLEPKWLHVFIYIYIHVYVHILTHTYLYIYIYI